MSPLVVVLEVLNNQLFEPLEHIDMEVLRLKLALLGLSHS